MRRGARKNRGYIKGYDTTKKKAHSFRESRAYHKNNIAPHHFQHLVIYFVIFLFDVIFACVNINI